MARKIIGITFITAAIIGLILSVGGIVLVWVVRVPLTDNLLNTVDLIGTTLEATNTGLATVDETLSKTISNISTLEITIQTASSAVDDSVPMVETISDLLTTNFPDAIEATQTGLITLQDAARSIESTLELITNIPFLPIERYAPEKSFTDSVEDISTSLEPISQSLLDMEGSLTTTKTNMVTIASQLRTISQNIGDLKSSLSDIQLVLEEYRDVIATAQEKVDLIHENMGLFINVTAWIFTIIFVWLGIAQLGLLTQGLERVDWHPRGDTDVEESSPNSNNEEHELAAHEDAVDLQVEENSPNSADSNSGN
jgi:methyl-accepting chemotaxis protein